MKTITILYLYWLWFVDCVAYTNTDSIYRYALGCPVGTSWNAVGCLASIQQNGKNHLTKARSYRIQTIPNHRTRDAFMEISRNGAVVATLHTFHLFGFVFCQFRLKEPLCCFDLCSYHVFVLQQNGEAPLINGQVLVMHNVWHSTFFYPRRTRDEYDMSSAFALPFVLLSTSIQIAYKVQCFFSDFPSLIPHILRPSKRWKKKIKSSSEVEWNVDKPKPKPKHT